MELRVHEQITFHTSVVMKKLEVGLLQIKFLNTQENLLQRKTKKRRMQAGCDRSKPQQNCSHAGSWTRAFWVKARYPNR